MYLTSVSAQCGVSGGDVFNAFLSLPMTSTDDFKGKMFIIKLV